MKMSYFRDTYTLYIEFKQTDVVESKDLDEQTIGDVNAAGTIISIASNTLANEQMCTNSH